MPNEELPEEFIKPILSPSNSSLSSSNSDVILINAHYVRDSRSTSISSSNSTNVHDDDSFDLNVISRRNGRHPNDIEECEEEEKYEPIRLPSEPTLEELLVIKIYWLIS